MKMPKLVVLFIIVICGSFAASGQSPSPTPLSAQTQAIRDATRERLRTLLANPPKDVPIVFRQSEKQPYNFVGTQTTGLKNSQQLEVVISVTQSETIGFRIYPHFNGGYINIDKARNSAGLMRKLLLLSDANFLFWGADATGDVFAGYTFTLESGFPEESVRVVLRSIPILDRFVGEMRPNVDGSSPSP